MVEGADENGDVNAKLAKFLVLAGNRFFKFGDGGAEADFELRSGLTGLVQFPVLGQDSGFIGRGIPPRPRPLRSLRIRHLLIGRTYSRNGLLACPQHKVSRSDPALRILALDIEGFQLPPRAAPSFQLFSMIRRANDSPQCSRREHWGRLTRLQHNPCYLPTKRNPLARLATVAQTERLTVWVVNHGSADGTIGVAERGAPGLEVKLVRHTVNRGLGQAVQSGLRARPRASSDVGSRD